MDIKQFKKYMDKLEKSSPQLLDKIIDQTAIVVDAEAKKRAPVDTGNLRSSITTKKGSGEATVGTNVEYAAPVEFGTSTHGAQPFMTPAKQVAESKLPTIMAGEVKKYVDN